MTVETAVGLVFWLGLLAGWRFYEWKRSQFYKRLSENERRKVILGQLPGFDETPDGNQLKDRLEKAALIWFFLGALITGILSAPE